METNVMYAIETGIRTFINSEDCSQTLKNKIVLEQKQDEFKDVHFHDLVSTILVASVSTFLATLAANIATEYFRKKFFTKNEAIKVAENASDIRLNEIRLRTGPDASKEISISKQEIKSFSRYVYEACEEIKK